MYYIDDYSLYCDPFSDEYFEYVAAGTMVVSAGLGLWWLADKVRDSVNAKPSDDAENKPAQSPHDDEQAPPQV